MSNTSIAVMVLLLFLAAIGWVFGYVSLFEMIVLVVFIVIIYIVLAMTVLRRYGY